MIINTNSKKYDEKFGKQKRKNPKKTKKQNKFHLSEGSFSNNSNQLKIININLCSTYACALVKTSVKTSVERLNENETQPSIKTNCNNILFHLLQFLRFAVIFLLSHRRGVQMLGKHTNQWLRGSVRSLRQKLTVIRVLLGIFVTSMDTILLCQIM